MPELIQSPELLENFVGPDGEDYAFLTQIIRDRGLFEAGSMIQRSIGNGVILILGKLSGDPTGPLIPHALRFQKSLWSPEQTRVWLANHLGSFSIDESEIKKEYANLQSISNVEIFAAGTWNGDTYTVKDLDQMIQAFEENKTKFKPFLKLGHDSEQKFLQKEGLPAAGWVGRIFRKGDKLLADFVDIPKKIFELIKNKAYRKVSAEIYWNIDINGRKYPKLLSAVSLLGAEHPAVSSLNDILGMFSQNNFESLKAYVSNEATIKNYLFQGGKMEKSENEIKLEYSLKETEKKLAELTAKLDEVSSSVKTKEETIAELEKFKLEAQEKLEQEIKKSKEAELNASVSDLEKTNLVTPAMVPYVKELLSEDKKEYSINDKKLSKVELLKETLKLFKAGSVNFDENSDNGDTKDQNSFDVLDVKIAQYAKDNNISYTQAYKIVMKDK